MTTTNAYLFNGLRPLTTQEHNYSTLTPTAFISCDQQPKVILSKEVPNIPPMMTAAVQRDPTAKVLGKKPVILRSQKVTSQEFSPLHGIDSRIDARNHPSDPLTYYKPKISKLTPYADSQFAALNNKLKQPK